MIWNQSVDFDIFVSIPQLEGQLLRLEIYKKCEKLIGLALHDLTDHSYQNDPE